MGNGLDRKLTIAAFWTRARLGVQAVIVEVVLADYLRPVDRVDVAQMGTLAYPDRASGYCPQAVQAYLQYGQF